MSFHFYKYLYYSKYLILMNDLKVNLVIIFKFMHLLKIYKPIIY